MPLTDTTVRNAKPADKIVRLYDEAGMYLEISPAGGKWWRLKYRFGGKEKRLALGTYPEVGLKEARAKRDDARKLLADGIDPGAQRKAQKAAGEIRAANSFEVVALEWLEGRRDRVMPAQHEKTFARMKNDVFPWIGKRPIAEIEAPEILALMQRVDKRGARYTAHRIRSEISQVFRFAIATGRAKADPAQPLIGAIPPAVERHFSSITDPVQVGEMLRAFDAFSGTLPVQCALRLAPLLFVRPGELRTAQWCDIDLDAGVWWIPADHRKLRKAEKQKADNKHLVPLARQAVAILRDLYPLTGSGRFVFPCARSDSRPMSGAAINAALRRIGFDTRTEITGHGFRAMARTILHEHLNFPPEVIEHQLAHAVPDVLGAAYNRTKFYQQRVEMMQEWADYLDRLKAGRTCPSFGTPEGSDMSDSKTRKPKGHKATISFHGKYDHSGKLIPLDPREMIPGFDEQKQILDHGLIEQDPELFEQFSERLVDLASRRNDLRIKLNKRLKSVPSKVSHRPPKWGAGFEATVVYHVDRHLSSGRVGSHEEAFALVAYELGVRHPGLTEGAVEKAYKRAPAAWKQSRKRP